MALKVINTQRERRIQTRTESEGERENKHSSASFKPLLYSLFGSTPVHSDMNLLMSLVVAIVPAIHQSLFFYTAWLYYVFIYIYSFCCFPHSLHSLEEQHKTFCAESRANHFAFITAFYRNSNFHMIYNMIFLFLVFIHSCVDEWDAAALLHECV